MGELLKKRFELFVKMRWLKTINKEVDRCKKLEEKLNRSRYVVNSLVKAYLEEYGVDLRNTAKGGE